MKKQLFLANVCFSSLNFSQIPQAPTVFPGNLREIGQILEKNEKENDQIFCQLRNWLIFKNKMSYIAVGDAVAEIGDLNAFGEVLARHHVLVAAWKSTKKKTKK